MVEETRSTHFSSPSRLTRFLRYLLLRTKSGRYLHDRAYDAGKSAGLTALQHHMGLPFCLFVQNVEPNPLADKDWRWFAVMDSRTGAAVTLCGVNDKNPQEAVEFYLSLLRREDAAIVGHVEIHPDPDVRLRRLTELEGTYRDANGQFLVTSQVAGIVESGGNLHAWKCAKGKASWERYGATLGDVRALPVLVEWLQLAGRKDLAERLVRADLFKRDKELYTTVTSGSFDAALKGMYGKE